MNKKRIIVLGCTGSIGRQTLDIISANPDIFELVGFSAYSDKKGFEKTAQAYPKAKTAFFSENIKADYYGLDAPSRLVSSIDADIVVNGISGADGLKPTETSLLTGKDVALANKESIVMGGEFLLETARKKGRSIIPVDSEHSAIFSLINGSTPRSVSELILTASGGAFRDTPIGEFDNAPPEKALSHPTWSMGKKITIDSATMANKGLEIIEASVLFGFPSSRISVLIHPQSIVHSLIRTTDGILYAQLSKPDMRGPIRTALFFPQSPPVPLEPLDLSGYTLSFSSPDTKRYPLLDTARYALEHGIAHRIAFNASNEAAVGEYFKRSLSFGNIAQVVSDCVSSVADTRIGSVTEALIFDRECRETASRMLSRWN